MSDIAGKYYFSCLKTDVPGACGVMKRAGVLRDKAAESLRRKVIARFMENTEQERISCRDALVRDVIRAYHGYYKKAFFRREELAKLNKALTSELRKIAHGHGLRLSAAGGEEKLEEGLKREFRKRGFFSLWGGIAPFRSLLVWRKERSRQFKVRLPETVQNVNVVFLEGFVELGWLAYATFGRYHVGGWAHDSALYCVKKAYKIGSRDFAVNYLSHEAQHFADYKTFPELKQADLEYRAKLVQLAFAAEPAKYLLSLKKQAANDALAPHSFAAYCLVRDLKGGGRNENLSAQAVRLLREHTEALRQAGAGKVESVLCSS